MPTAINHPLPEGRKWGDPLPWRDDGEVYQLEVCRGHVGALSFRLFRLWTERLRSPAVCDSSKVQAEIDFPGEDYPCSRVYRSDLTQPMGLPIDQT